MYFFALIYLFSDKISAVKVNRPYFGEQAISATGDVQAIADKKILHDRVKSFEEEERLRYADTTDEQPVDKDSSSGSDDPTTPEPGTEVLFSHEDKIDELTRRASYGSDISNPLPATQLPIHDVAGIPATSSEEDISRCRKRGSVKDPRLLKTEAVRTGSKKLKKSMIYDLCC